MAINSKTVDMFYNMAILEECVIESVYYTIIDAFTRYDYPLIVGHFNSLRMRDRPLQRGMFDS